MFKKKYIDVNHDLVKNITASSLLKSIKSGKLAQSIYIEFDKTIKYGNIFKTGDLFELLYTSFDALHWYEKRKRKRLPFILC